MIFSSNKIIKIIKKNIEITFLFLLLLITISSTTIYNKKKISVDLKSMRFQIELMPLRKQYLT